MKLFALLTAALAIGNAIPTRLNAIEQQGIVDLLRTRRQVMMAPQKPMTPQRVMAMQGISSKDMMEGQELMTNPGIRQRQGMPEILRIGLCSGVCSVQQVQQIAHDMIEQAQHVQMQEVMNNIDNVIQQTSSVHDFGKKVLAQQMAEQMTRQGQQALQAQMQQSVQQIQQQSQHMMSTKSMVQQMAQQQAVQELQKDIVEQQQQSLDPNNQIKKSLEILVEAEIVRESSKKQQTVQNPTVVVSVAQRVSNFQHQIQQLMKESNMQQIQAVIEQHEHEAQQIQNQHKFLTPQIKQLQLQLAMTRQQNIQPQQVAQKLEEAQQQMQQQQQQLMSQLMAHQTVVSQLQQILMSQQNQLQKQMIYRQSKQHLTQSNNPMMMMIMQVPMIM